MVVDCGVAIPNCLDENMTLDTPGARIVGYDQLMLFPGSFSLQKHIS